MSAPSFDNTGVMAFTSPAPIQGMMPQMPPTPQAMQAMSQPMSANAQPMTPNTQQMHQVMPQSMMPSIAQGMQTMPQGMQGMATMPQSMPPHMSPQSMQQPLPGTVRTPGSAMAP